MYLAFDLEVHARRASVCDLVLYVKFDDIVGGTWKLMFPDSQTFRISSKYDHDNKHTRNYIHCNPYRVVELQELVYAYLWLGVWHV